MTEDISTHHAPAVKVGGRRLSVSKHKAPILEQHVNVDDGEQTSMVSPGPDDYPRPAPPGEERPHPPPPHLNDDEALKKDKHGLNKDRLKELTHNKLEATRPTRDALVGGKGGYGAGGRIAQPAGKGLGA